MEANRSFEEADIISVFLASSAGICTMLLVISVTGAFRHLPIRTREQALFVIIVLWLLSFAVTVLHARGGGD